MDRRAFLKVTAAGTLGLYVAGRLGPVEVVQAEAIPGGTLDPATIPAFVTPLLIPPQMPKAGVDRDGKRAVDVYEIAVRQFSQQILPAGLPATTVWGYGPAKVMDRRAPRVFHAPSLTIEADHQRPVRVTWINDLRDTSGRFLPHLLPVDPTLHWANPVGGRSGRDTRPTFASTPGAYRGPVPLVTHVHGAVGVGDESDGYPEAWFLPDARNIPKGYARVGTWYDFFGRKAKRAFGADWSPGSATFQYPNTEAGTKWYHDHTLGMTRLNVYAGPAGFFLVRGGPRGDDKVRDTRTGRPAVLPQPAPSEADYRGPARPFYEIPIAVQDRAFNADGSLFYPDTRAFFDGVTGPFVPDGDLSPIWNPEFFGNCLMVNGNTWPYLDVEQRRYRLRLLNGCQARFLILDFSTVPGVEVWQIGHEGGFLTAPVDVTGTVGGRVLLAPAERADLIVDFTGVPLGNHVLANIGPDEPFAGGEPGSDFGAADPATTGRVLQFRVGPRQGTDRSTPGRFLQLPPLAPLGAATARRPLALLEVPSATNPDSPAAAMLGTVTGDPATEPAATARQAWMDPITENPAAGATEVWEFYNTTVDAHPVHVHEVLFEVVDRQPIIVDEAAGTFQLAAGSGARPPEPAESGAKDTVIAYPGEVTRIKARWDRDGQFVWHCHIVEHEDNEMMRPYRVGPPQAGQPAT